MTSRIIFTNLKGIKELNSYIDNIYEQKETLKNDALREIKSEYVHLWEDDDSAFDENNHLAPPKQSFAVATAKKPSRVSRKKDPPISSTNKAPNDDVRKSSRISSSQYKSAIGNTFYSDAIDDGSPNVEHDKKPTPLENDAANQLEHAKIDKLPSNAARHRMGQLGEITVSKPKPDVSISSGSITTLDMINPIGASTPTRRSVSSEESDNEIAEKPNFHDPQFGKLDKQDSKSSTDAFASKPIRVLLPQKKVVAKPKSAQYDDAQKKKITYMNEQVEAKKRKREERTQKVAAQRAIKVAESREKRLVVLNYEKKKEDAKSKALKQKEIKSKSTQKKTEPKELPKIKPHVDILEYELDHIVEGASSEDETAPKKPVPQWATEEMREHPVRVQAWLDKNETVYKWFFNESLKTPVLEELFSTKVRMRTRTSSAVWHR